VRRTARIASVLLLAGLAGAPGVVAAAAAAEPAPAASQAAALSVTTLPADGAEVTATDQVFARFSAPIAPLGVETFTIHEVVDGAAGAALAGGSVQTTDEGATWQLQLPSLLGRKATYEVRITGAQTLDAEPALTTSWRFTTDDEGPPPKALTSLQTAAVPGAVALSWSGPVDFDRVAVVLLRTEGTTPPGPSDPATAVVGVYPEPLGAAVDATVAAGKTYTYAAYAVDRLQRVSDFFLAPPVSVPNSVLPTQPEPTQPIQTPTVQPDQPTTPKPVSIAQERLPRLQFPLPGKRLAAGRSVRIRWAANPQARYYNVQIFRGKLKVATSFPVRGSLAVMGRLLRPGTYRIVIWSGLGAKLNSRYAARPWVNQVVRVGGAVAASKPSSKASARR
jgi:hypothetical protein